MWKTVREVVFRFSFFVFRTVDGSKKNEKRGRFSFFLLPSQYEKRTNDIYTDPRPKRKKRQNQKRKTTLAPLVFFVFLKSCYRN